MKLGQSRVFGLSVTPGELGSWFDEVVRAKDQPYSPPAVPRVSSTGNAGWAVPVFGAGKGGTRSVGVYQQPTHRRSS